MCYRHRSSRRTALAPVSPYCTGAAHAIDMVDTTHARARRYALMHCFFQCPYAQRSVIASRELGLPFQLHPIQLGKDNKEPWYTKINPAGKVR
jgi:Glutathione S-transferase, N-terminal domain